MRTKLSKAFFAFCLLISFGSVYAQDDLIAMNEVNSQNSIVDFYKTNEKILISDFKRVIGSEEAAPIVTIKSDDAITMNVRIFNTSGDLAKEETHPLSSGLNNLSVDMSDLSQGVYMVQFYTKEGSTLRRYIKYN